MSPLFPKMAATASVALEVLDLIRDARMRAALVIPGESAAGRDARIDEAKGRLLNALDMLPRLVVLINDSAIEIQG